MKRPALFRALALCSLLALALAAPPAFPDQDLMVKAFIDKNCASILKEYSELLSIPNIASDRPNIRRNAEAIVVMLRRRGVEARLLEGEGGPPLVYGEIAQPGAKRTVIFYAHYDGQPVDPAQWKDDPWKPALRDGRLEDGGKIIDPSAVTLDRGRDYRLYGRSTSDDKAPIMALAAAVDFLKSESSLPSINVKLLFEGEEEAGSPHLQGLLRKYRELLRADAMFICDGPVDQTGRMQVTFGARGSMGLEMTVYGPNHPLHSGHYGNWAPNPISLLASLLAGMRNEEGAILIEGFYDRVRPISEADQKAIAELPDIDARLRREYGLAWSEAGNARLASRILMPALNFRGLEAGAVGAKAANAVPAQARASIDFRLVPDQDPDTVKKLVEAHIAARGFHIIRKDPNPDERIKLPKLIKLEWEDGYPPYRLALDDPFGRAVARTLGGVLSEPPLRLPALGGSVPMKMFADVLGIPVLGLPIANYDNNQHGPNENIRLQNLWDGIAVFVALLSGLGQAW
jgi:acetylornithine deacetylase/succinyl-diaminopimelate desuccinylase-like protein